MQIDWFTFAAQIINFLVLVWLLKRFLYKPVLAAMEKRKASLVEKFHEAEIKRLDLDQEKNRLKHMQLELETSIEKEMSKARQAAEVLKGQLLTEVRQEADANRKQWLALVEKEKKYFLEQTSKTISRQFDLLSRNALTELADEGLEERIILTFISKVKDDQEVGNMLRAAANSEPFTVFSSFKIAETQKQKIAETITSISGKPVELNYIEDKTLIAGIALEADGKKVRWDLHHYLEDFQKEVEKTLQKAQGIS